MFYSALVVGIEKLIFWRYPWRYPWISFSLFLDRKRRPPAQGLGFRVQGLGFRVQGLVFRVQGFQRVQGLGFRVQGRVKIRTRELGFRVQGLGFRVFTGFRVQGLGFLEGLAPLQIDPEPLSDIILSKIGQKWPRKPPAGLPLRRARIRVQGLGF